MRQLAAAFSVARLRVSRFRIQDSNWNRETGDGKSESGSKLPHSEGALWAQCCDENHGLGVSPAFPEISIVCLSRGGAAIEVFDKQNLVPLFVV